MDGIVVYISLKQERKPLTVHKKAETNSGVLIIFFCFCEKIITICIHKFFIR